MGHHDTPHTPKDLEHPSVLFCLFVSAIFFGIGSESGGNTIFFLSGLVCLILILARVRIFFLIALIGLFSGALLARYSVDHHSIKTDTLTRSISGFTKAIPLEGTVREYMSRKENMLRYRLDHIMIEGQRLISDIGIFLTLPENLTLSLGERIRFRGKITLLADSDTFHYSKYGWIHDTYGETRAYTFTRISQEKRNVFMTSLDHIRSTFTETTRGLFPYEVRALALGMTLGNTLYFTEGMKTHFSQSGLTHLVAVSGSNMTLVILFLTLFLRFLPIGKYGRIILIAIGILCYCALVGWNIPAIRAACMGIIGYIALSAGRSMRPLPLLFGTALIFIILEPLTLLYDVSFQLSFMAVWGLIIFRDILESWTEKIPNFLELRSALIVTLSATLATLPISLANFGTFPTLSLLANILVAPLVALATIMGALSIIVSLFSYTFGFILGFIPYTFFAAILFVSEKIGALTWSVIPLDFLPLYREYILLGVLFIVTWMSIEYTYDRQLSSKIPLQK